MFRIIILISFVVLNAGCDSSSNKKGDNDSVQKQTKLDIGFRLLEVRDLDAAEAATSCAQIKFAGHPIDTIEGAQSTLSNLIPPDFGVDWDSIRIKGNINVNYDGSVEELKLQFEPVDVGNGKTRINEFMVPSSVDGIFNMFLEDIELRVKCYSDWNCDTRASEIDYSYHFELAYHISDRAGVTGYDSTDPDMRFMCGKSYLVQVLNVHPKQISQTLQRIGK